MEENLRKWFKEEDWVRIDTQGNIAGKCGTMKKGKKTQRCLPRKKAQSLSKAERKATARKKTSSKKQFVKNTKKAKVSLKKENMDLKSIILKTLEKEGGAAGLKALSKAAKTSKKDLKKSLSKMSGVKQHKDGDYISTPINEASKQIFEMLTEKLCKKGKAYVARRKAAGEKHGAYLMGRAVKVCKGQMSGKKKKNENTAPNHDGKAAPYGSGYDPIEEQVYYIDSVDEIQMIEDALNEEYCSECTISMEEGRKKGKCKPSKGKRFAKRVNGKCRSFGQKGKASDGGDRIRPGTKKAHAYCARSAKIKKCKNPPCANTLSRRKWKCQGSRSVPESIIPRLKKLAGI